MQAKSRTGEGSIPAASTINPLIPKGFPFRQPSKTALNRGRYGNIWAALSNVEEACDRHAPQRTGAFRESFSRGEYHKAYEYKCARCEVVEYRSE